MKIRKLKDFNVGLQSVPVQTDVYHSDGEGTVLVLYFREESILFPRCSILGRGNQCLIQRIIQHRETYPIHRVSFHSL